MVSLCYYRDARETCEILSVVVLVSYSKSCATNYQLLDEPGQPIIPLSDENGDTCVGNIPLTSIRIDLSVDAQDLEIITTLDGNIYYNTDSNFRFKKK